MSMICSLPQTHNTMNYIIRTLTLNSACRHPQLLITRALLHLVRQQSHDSLSIVSQTTHSLQYCSLCPHINLIFPATCVCMCMANNCVSGLVCAT